jgi:hypothetical protein
MGGDEMVEAVMLGRYYASDDLLVGLSGEPTWFEACESGMMRPASCFLARVGEYDRCDAYVETGKADERRVN